MTESTTCPQCGSPLSAQALHGICPRCLLQAGFESRPILPAGSNEEATYVGGSPAAPQPEEVAALFPQLEILELLGRGGMGAVYKARQRDLHRIVALKILPPELARDPAFGERFVREARALASLNHPHIVTIYDFGQTQGVYYLLMEYVDGVNLRQAQRAGKIEPEQVLGIVSQVCEALQYAHEEGVVHRDIKPENILLDRRGRVKIADFGLAKLVRNQPADLPLTQTQQVMGTLHYMAPEQLERPLQVDHRADIFSLGVVFYELLTGELPLGRFETPSHKVQVDVRLDEIVLRALERNPERRYQWASQVKTELDTVSHTPGPRPMPAATPPVPVSADQRTVANRLRIPAIGLCIIGAITCAVPLGMTVALFVMALGHSHGGVGLGPMEVLIACACVPIGVLLIVGSMQMLRLNSYSWAMATAILGIFPCVPLFFISLPLSIWALFVLSQDETQAAFEQRRQLRSVKPGSADASINLTGIGLLLSGGLQLLGGVIGALILPYVVVAGPNAVPSVAGLGMFLIYAGLCLVCSLLMILGGVQMLGRRSWGLAKAGAIAALIPLGPWWLIGFPCGLCALLVLYKPGVMELFKSAGSDRETPSRSTMSEAPSAAQPGVGWSELRARLMIPAIGLLCAAIIQVLFTVYVMAQVGDAPGPLVRSAIARLAPLLVVSLILSVLIALGGLQLLSRGSFGLAKAGAIAGLIPIGPSWMIGFPSALWALIVLHRPEIREAYRNRRHAGDQPVQPRPLTDSGRGGGGEPPETEIGDFDDWPPQAPRSRFQPAHLKLMALVGVVAIVAGILLALGPGWRAAMFDAADRGDAGRIHTLLMFSKDVTITDRNGETPLIHAARNGHVMAIRALTPVGAVDQPDRYGMTPLMFAAIQGHTGAVEALLDWKARVDAITPSGDTALLFAARNGHWDTLVSLLQRGANPTIQNRDGETALMLAAEHKHVSAVDILLRDKIWTPLDQKPGQSSRDEAINLRDKHGDTALMKGVLSQNVEIVRQLLAAHADPKLSRPDRTSPLHEAARIGNLPIIEMLLEADADPNQPRIGGETPLAIAVAFGADEVINTLSKRGATPVPALEVRRVYRLVEKGKIQEATEGIETALRQLPTDTQPCRFGLGGWTYEVPDERRLLQLLMADCARRAGKEDKAQESVEQALASWTADNYPVAIYVRRNSVPGTEVEETYSLRRAELAAWPGKNAALRLDYTSFRRETRPGRQTESRSQNEVEGLVH